MDFLLRVLAYSAGGLLLVTANVWFVRAVMNEFFAPGLPNVIAPFQVIRGDGSKATEGASLAHLLTARLASLRSEIEASTAALSANSEGPRPTNITQAVRNDDLITLPERVFEPLNVAVSVGGVEVGGLLNSLHRWLTDDRVLRITIHYSDKQTVIAGDIDNVAGGSFWHKTKMTADEEIVEELAYLLVYQQLTARITEIRALNITEFRQLMTALHDAAELNVRLSNGRLPSSAAYAGLLDSVDKLLVVTPNWAALVRLGAELADKAGVPARAAALYGQFLAIVDARHLSLSATERLALQGRLDELGKLEAARTAPLGAAADDDSPRIAQIRRMVGAEPLSASAAPLVAVVGPPPPAGTLPSARFQIAGAASDVASDSGLAEYAAFLVQAVQMITPDASFVFLGPGNIESNYDLARSLEQALAMTPAPDVILMAYRIVDNPERLVPVIRRAIQKGIPLVVSAGNDPKGPPSLSSLKDDIIIAAAVDDSGQAAPFTQSVEGCFWAPGTNIPLVLAGKQALQSGTSYSAAIAAGVVGALRKRLPALSLADTIARLRAAASSQGGPQAPRVINLERALKI